MTLQQVIDSVEQYAAEKALIAQQPQTQAQVPDIEALMCKNADAFALPREIVYGVVKKESAFEVAACRYEPEYKWLYEVEKVKPKICSAATETMFQKTSIGLMQVMGGVYRERGYVGWLSALCGDPDKQLYYGCKHLAAKIKKYGLEEGLAAYNSGSPVRLSSGQLKNQSYVNDVLKFSKEYQG